MAGTFDAVARRTMAAIYDPFMRRTEAACLTEWRGSLLASARGDVLEVGAGTGANLAHYADRVRSLTLAEPDANMRRQLDAKLAGGAAVPAARVTTWAIERVDAPDHTFDTVVATLVFCSVASQAEALAEVRRVLKPGGRLLFIEHVAAEGYPSREALQRAVDPLWCRVAGGCHVTRDTAGAMRDAGFVFEQFTRESMRKALPFLRPTIRGVARPA